MVSLSSDTPYQALSERALLDSESCRVLLKVTEEFLSKLKENCPKTVRRVLVGFCRSEYGVMLYFVPLSTFIEFNLSDPDFRINNQEQETIFVAEQ